MQTKTITVHRWYHNPEIWLNVVSAIGGLATLAIAQLSLLGLAGPTLFITTISLTVVANGANIVVKFVLPSIIASRKTIDAVAQMPNTENVTTEIANTKGTAAVMDIKINPGGR